MGKTPVKTGRRVGIAVLGATILIGGSLLLFGGASLPSDGHLLSEFERKQAAFGELAAALHNGQLHVPHTALQPLGIVKVSQDPRWPGVVFFVVDEVRSDVDPCETDIAAKGFAYCKTNVDPTLVTLEELDGKPGASFRPIRNGWYLFYKSLAETHCE